MLVENGPTKKPGKSVRISKRIASSTSSPRAGRATMPSRVIALLAAQRGDRVRQHRQQHGKILAHRPLAAGHIDDQRTAAYARHGAAQHRERRTTQTIGAQRFSDARYFVIEHSARRFGRYIAR